MRPVGTSALGCPANGQISPKSGIPERSGVKERSDLVSLFRLGTAKGRLGGWNMMGNVR